MLRKYLLYLTRWQLSTPILWAVIYYLHLPSIWETIIANLIGGLLFFWVDKLIFKEPETELMSPKETLKMFPEEIREVAINGHKTGKLQNCNLSEEVLKGREKE